MRREQWRQAAIIASIIVVGVFFRFSGLRWDEGSYSHPDERFLAIVADSIDLPGSPAEYFDTGASPLNPYNRGHSFFVYGTLPLFMTKVAAAGLGLDDSQHLYLVGRGLSALFDTLTLILTLLLGSELYSRRVGVVAALLVSACALQIQHAHFFVVDSFLTFFCVAALLFAVRFGRSHGWPDAALAGMAAGSALACKVGAFPVLVLIPVAGVLWLARCDPLNRRKAAISVAAKVLFSTAVAFVCFRIFQPYAFTSFSLIHLNPDFTSSLAQLAQLSSRLDFPPALQWHGTSLWWAIRQIIVWGMGVASGIAAFSGLALAVIEFTRDRRLSHVLPLVWILFVVLFFGLQQVRPMRYMLPAYPVLMILAAYALWRLVEVGEGQFSSRGRKAGLALLVLVCGLTTLWASAFSGIYRRPFVRAEATRWIRDNVPEGSTVAVEEWDDALPAYINGRPVASFPTVTLQIYERDSAEKIRQLVLDLEKADFLFINSQRGYGSIPRHPERYPATTRYYDLLFTERLGFNFRRGFTSYPRIAGLEINTDGADESFSVYDHPKILIFEKEAGFDSGRVGTALRSALGDRSDARERDRLVGLAHDLVTDRR